MSDPQIYVRGFSKNCRQADLKQSFSKFGNIKQVRLIRDYAFIVFTNRQEVDVAVKQMDGEKFQDYRLRVQVAGRPRKTKGPQPNDECRYCRKLGHWQNNCPDYRQRRDDRRRRSYSSSSSSSSDSDRSRRSRKRSKKIKKNNRKRSYSSSSSSSSESSSSRSSSGERQKNRKEKPKQDQEK